MVYTAIAYCALTKFAYCNQALFENSKVNNQQVITDEISYLF